MYLPDDAYFFRVLSVARNAFATKGIKLYTFRTTSVMVYTFLTTGDKAYDFWSTSISACLRVLHGADVRASPVTARTLSGPTTNGPSTEQPYEWALPTNSWQGVASLNGSLASRVMCFSSSCTVQPITGSQYQPSVFFSITVCDISFRPGTGHQYIPGRST